MDFASLFQELGFFDLIDIGVMTFLVYLVLVWFKKTRAASVLIGILIVAGFYLIARQFNLFLTASVFQAFFAVILVAVVVIFQEELRHFFERVAVWGRTPFWRRKTESLSHNDVALLVRSLTDFAKERIGALIILKGKDMVVRHLEGGEVLNGKLSEAILKSLFDPHSPGHDGALIIEGNDITQFGCHLPLSKNFKLLKDRGTRHAAALGMSELTDALCLVVSEEQGTISGMRHGELHKISNPEELNTILEQFYREIVPPKEPLKFKDYFRKDSKEKMLALGLALLLWFLHVYGSRVTYWTLRVPVSFAPLTKEWVIAKVEPEEVEVTFSGPRRAFYFLSKKRITVLLKTWQAAEGVHTLRVSASDVTVPKNFVIENILPKRVQVKIESNPRLGPREEGE